DPFAPSPPALDFTAANATGATTIQFVRLANVLRESGLTIADLRYLLLDEDRGGGRAPRSLEEVFNALRRLEQGLTQVRAAFEQPADMTSITSDDLRQRLSVRYPEDVAATFVGMLDGTTRFAVTREGTASALVSPAELAAFPDIDASF